VDAVCRVAAAPSSATVTLKPASPRRRGVDDRLHLCLLIRRRIHFLQHVLDVRPEMIGHSVEAHSAMVHATLAVSERERAARHREDGAGNDRSDEDAPFAGPGGCLFLHIRLLEC
jgi:hypothetical protein